ERYSETDEGVLYRFSWVFPRTEIEAAKRPGLGYSPVCDRLVVWAGGTTVYSLNLDTKEWTRIVSTGTVDPGPQNSKGTQGRWRYVRTLDVFVVVNSVDENVFVYRCP
ncbi:MAG: hypothetical protein ACYSUN_05990, partial [Planctomycetota bacterium]